MINMPCILNIYTTGTYALFHKLDNIIVLGEFSQLLTEISTLLNYIFQY